MAQVVACPKTPVERVARLLPEMSQERLGEFRETLEHNQKLASCCRDTSGHAIEAWYSTKEWGEATGIPDIYIFHCTCGRQHRRFMVGGGDVRPKWECR
jgi:hypothetical protein